MTIAEFKELLEAVHNHEDDEDAELEIVSDTGQVFKIVKVSSPGLDLNVRVIVQALPGIRSFK